MRKPSVAAARPSLLLFAVLLAMALKAGGCRKKPSPAGTPAHVRPTHGFVTPLLTPPPPLPTPTLWRKDITRIPTLPG